MRSLSGAERTLLAGSRLGIHVRVEIKDTDGNWRDMSALGTGAIDWLNDVSWGGSVDDPVITGTVTLHREVGTQSLAPFMSASGLNRNGAGAYAPLLNAGRSIRVYAATVASGVTPSSGDWRLLVDGKVDEVAWGGDEPLVPIQFRDIGARLLDTFIEVKRTYGSAAGVPVETVMQQILNDNGLSSITLFTPVSPGWQLGTAARPLYEQDYSSVLEALRTLAIQIGWDVRYKWNNVSAAFELTFYQPNRAKVVTDATFAATEYFSARNLSVSDIDVRNAWTGTFYDYALKGAVTIGPVEHLGSIAEFGRRAAHIGEDHTSNIDSVVEMTAMLTAALNDTAFPAAEIEIETMLFWPVEVGDLYRYTANGVHFDQDHDLAVIAYRHTLANGDGRSVITARGQVAGAYREWLNKGGGVSTLPTVNFGVPAPVFGPLAAEAGTMGQTTYGALWLPIRWDQYTDSVRVSFVEQAATPVPNPFAEGTLDESALIVRPEGTVPQTDPWIVYHRIPMTPSWYGRVVVQAFSDDGKFSAVFTAEIQAIDTGTAPTAGPTALTVTVVGTTNRVQFTVGDGTAEHLVYRDQLNIYVIPAGTYATGATATFDDTGLTTGSVHDYDVLALKSGQTPNPATSNGTIGGGSNQASAPLWSAGYPVGSGSGSSAVVAGLWTCADAVATGVEWQESDDGQSGWALLQIAAKNPPSYIADAQYPEGTDKFFRLKAIGGGGLYSTTKHARYGTNTLPPPSGRPPLT